MVSPILKGFLIGSSSGVIASFFGFISSIPRGFFLGTVVGLLAGITMEILVRYKYKKKK